MFVIVNFCNILYRTSRYVYGLFAYQNSFGPVVREVFAIKLKAKYRLSVATMLFSLM
jgi:hypothetical protein